MTAQRHVDAPHRRQARPRPAEKPALTVLLFNLKIGAARRSCVHRAELSDVEPIPFIIGISVLPAGHHDRRLQSTRCAANDEETHG